MLRICIRAPFVALVLLCAFALEVAAADGEPERENVPAVVASSGRDLGPAADGIRGLVVNQTITARGYDFYQIFSILWSEKPDSGNYSLSVQERHLLSGQGLRKTSQVGIFLGQKQVFSALLPWKREGVEDLGERAANEILANITAAMIEFTSDDIARAEL
jgi:hypothetical protein